MKYIILTFSLLLSTISYTQNSNFGLVINEVLPATNELELKNTGSSTINIYGTRIQSQNNSEFLVDNTEFICGGFMVPPGQIVAISIPYPIVSMKGEFFVSLNGQTAVAFVQWGEIGGFASTAFSLGLWDDPASFLPSLQSGSSLELVDVSEKKNIDGWLAQDDPTLCDENTQCAINNIKIDDITCIDNDTPSDPTDDYFTFTLQIDGINLPPFVNITIDGEPVDPAAYPFECIDCFITSFEFSPGEELVLKVLSDNMECSFTQTFTSPETCSPVCNMQSSQFIFLECDDNNTSADPTDDYIHFIVRPFGFNLDEEYYLEFSTGNVIGPLVNSEPFEVISSQGFYSPGDGDFEVIVIDGGDLNCSETITIVDQDHCSPNCTVYFDSLSVRCDNGGTPYDDSDDFYTVDLQVSSTASASLEFQLSLDPFSPIPQMYNYGELYSFSSTPGSTVAINGYAMSILDPAYPSCIGITLNGMLNEGCLTECDIFPADIALENGPLICIEPIEQTTYTFDIINGIEMDTFLLLALNEFDDIVFITDKLSFDPQELGAGIFNFVVVHFIELSEAEIGNDIDRLEGCFALSPFYQVEITIQENCSTATKYENLRAISIYPNPVHDLLCISQAQLGDIMKVYDIYGRLVISGKTESCMDVSFLKDGVYYVTVTDREGVQLRTDRMVKG